VCEIYLPDKAFILHELFCNMQWPILVKIRPQNVVHIRITCPNCDRSDDLSEFLVIIFPLVYTIYFLGNVINVRGSLCIMQVLTSFTNWLQQVVHLRFTSPSSLTVFALC